MATPPPRAEKWRRRGPSRSLLRLAKVTQKRGFSQRFSDSFASGLPTVSQRFCRWFDRGFLVVSGRFGRRFDRRFAGDAVPLDQPRSGSGPPFEKRESGNYSDTLINAILSRAQGKTLAIPAATAALEMCAGVVGRSRR